MNIYLIKEDPKISFDENIDNKENKFNFLNPKITVENNNTFILQISNLKIEIFKNLEINNQQHLKVDLKNTFDPYR